MSKITVSFDADARTEDDARAFVNNLRRDAEGVGARNLTYVSLAQPIEFATQADLDNYVRARGGQV